MAFAILRYEKLKTLGNVGSSLSHNYRTIETPNAEKNKTEWLAIPCNLYVIKMAAQDEVFYKIGITSQDISRRFREHDTTYEVNVLELIESNRFDAIILENKLHDLHKEYKYKPKQFFKGHTECFIKFKGISND